MSVARKRLTQERAEWRKDHPHGFVAKFARAEEGENKGQQDCLKWECRIPGKKDTLWGDATYPLTMEFTDEYPGKPPKCKFPQGFFHPNVYPSGTVCLSILNEDEDWKPSITIKQVLLGIQDLLDNPNPQSPAQGEPYMLYQQNKEEYNRKVKEQADSYRNQS
ncbi:unnamed protein product [Vitrella brassicaformis CCMP3155]|uniref:SUMO-conjugating enzyme UBC9 n=2 Tax=Vitrella brassicaformis TaxID=1169539 RepID=A0A0G4G5S5_VITBC|nr:unnamed protein product [Vitrella brassicaformis CCMP3155]|mmetsp:Transcript_49819/g.124906  ORF Transcript_49819/g.124906 Transcript_49819/m.124906 type:complete len:163 (+) Transcript_49819:113-601(+)|eukprot:CEM23430.1 unnamed protein product [Vitrella brassicaformis CCMP3155]